MTGHRDTAADGGITATVDVPAPAEAVYGVLTDPARATRWLPVGMVAEPVTADRIRVRAYGRTTDVRLTRDEDALAVGWTTAGDPRLTAAAEVREAGAGGSEVRIRLGVPGEWSTERLHGLLDEFARHLRRDVDDNFTAG